LAIKQKLKYRYGIIFTYFWPHLRPNNDNFQKLAVVATVTKFAQKKKTNKQTKEVKTVVVKENAQRLTLHLVV